MRLLISILVLLTLTACDTEDTKVTQDIVRQVSAYEFPLTDSTPTDTIIVYIVEMMNGEKVLINETIAEQLKPGDTYDAQAVPIQNRLDMVNLTPLEQYTDDLTYQNDFRQLLLNFIEENMYTWD